MLRFALCVLLCAPALAAPPAAKAVIRPAPSGDFLTPGLELHQVPGKANVRVVNDTQLYMSAQFVSLGANAKVLQGHAASAFSLFDKKLIGPQDGLSGGYWAGTSEFAQPQGDNCVVDIVTPGFGTPDRDLTSAEQSLRRRLLIRSAIDSVVLPLLTSLAGHPSLTGKSKGAQVVGTFLLSQNHSIFKDVGSISGGKDVAMAIVNALLRDLTSAGPLTSFLIDQFGEAIAKAILKRLAIEIALEAGSTGIPPAKVVLYAARLLNWGPTAAQIANWLYDLNQQPSLKRFTVLFKPGASEISPRRIHAGRSANVFTVSGYKLNAPGKSPKVRLYDSRDQLVYQGSPFSYATDGESMRVRVPGKVVDGISGHLTCVVQFSARDSVDLPDRITIINSLTLDRVEPAAGHPKQRVRIFGNGFHPFDIANTVYFGTSRHERRRGNVIAATREYLDVEVPWLPESPSTVSVWVNEKYGSTIKESEPIPFERLPGTLAEAERRRLAALMPETEQVFDGVLTKKHPRYVKAINVTAGMQVVATLESLSGPASNPHRFVLEGWGLTIRARADGRAVQKWVDHDRGPITTRQPNRTAHHTTAGGRAANVYYLRLDRKSGKEIRFRVRVKTIAKGDAAQGQDAGSRPATAMDLRSGGPFQCHLYGEPHVYREDRVDWYRIPNVPGGERLRVTLHRLRGEPREQVRLRSVTLYRIRNGRRERAAATPNNVRARDGDIVLVQEDTATRTCYLQVVHGAGLVDYQISVAIDAMPGGRSDLLPITSRFDDGIDDNWTVLGNFAAGPRAPTLQSHGRGNGYIRSHDPQGTPRAPLDVVFVIDTTGSMKGPIDSVRTGTQAIVRELRRRSSSLRVGVVSFKDWASDRGSARAPQELSDQVESRLRLLGNLSTGGGGGDGPEDALYGLEGALAMRWREQDDAGREVARVVMLITDAAFKLEGRKDFGGRSIRSIALAARKRGITVYPMPVSKDATLRAQSVDLARQTQGQVLRVENAAGVAQAIQDILDFAVDSSSPRYFNAPPKFLGDVSRFYGRCLEWQLRGSVAGREFHDPDVILRSGERTLEMRTAMAPPPGGQGMRSDFRRVCVRLTADHRWHVKSTGKRATEAELRGVLRSLTGIEIRGEFYAGTEWCDLDNVILGGPGPVTDAGLTDIGVEQLDYFIALAQRMRRERDQLEADFRHPMALLQRHYQAAGVSNAGGAALSDGSSVSLAVYHVSGSDPGLIDAVYTVELERLERNIAYFRRRGGVPKEHFADAIADVKALNRRLAGLRVKLKLYLDTLAVRAKARHARDRATGGAWHRLGQLVLEGDRNVKNVERELAKERGPVSIRVLGAK